MIFRLIESGVELRFRAVQKAKCAQRHEHFGLDYGSHCILIQKHVCYMYIMLMYNL